MKKTKKQHYVPRCYLKAFQIPGSNQVYVFDKKTANMRISNINDVASENYFYDLEFDEKILPESALVKLQKNHISIKDLNNEQYIEKYLATAIESKFATMLDKLVNQINSVTPWVVNSCSFISETQKRDFSLLLAVQYIRTKLIRKSIFRANNEIMRLIKGLNLNFSQEALNSYRLTNQKIKLIHAKIITNSKQILETAQLLYGLTWMLGINQTPQKLYTSDAPIGMQSHLKGKGPFASPGLAKRGVECFFPITPNGILIMVDSSYHKRFSSEDRNYCFLTHTENIDYYNSLSVLQSERCVFSSENNFSLIKRMRREQPEAFESTIW